MFGTNRARALGLLAVLAAAVLWGTTGTVQALLPAEPQPLVVAACRLLIGAAALLALAGLSGAARRAFRRLPARWIFAAGLAIGAYNLMFFAAVTQTGVGIGTALAIGSAPLWATAFELVLSGRGPDRRRLAGQAICICGSVLLVLSGAATPASAGGMAVAGLAGSAYAAYSLITSRIGQCAPSATIAAATFSVAAVLVAPALVLMPSTWALEPASWPKLAFLGVVATGLAYALYTWGLRHVAPSTAVTLALAEPLTAWFLATVVVGEPVTPGKLAGAVMLLIGLAVVTGRRNTGAS
jgi:DME family drug/metabolite transporter